jgi:hydrogenase maturation protease
VTRVLVAGIGNMFFGDDGFGSEVVRQLGGPLPPGTRVADFGIRVLHLAYELLVPIELLVIADCMQRGGMPGTLYVIEPDAAALEASVADAHGASLATLFATVRELGGTIPPTRLVGCEPESVEPGMGLSPAVTRALAGAADLIRELISHPEVVT